MLAQQTIRVEYVYELGGDWHYCRWDDELGYMQSDPYPSKQAALAAVVANIVHISPVAQIPGDAEVIGRVDLMQEPSEPGKPFFAERWDQATGFGVTAYHDPNTIREAVRTKRAQWIKPGVNDKRNRQRWPMEEPNAQRNL